VFSVFDMIAAKDIAEFEALSREWDGFLPVSLAAVIAGVSRTRIYHLLGSGRLPGCVFCGWTLVGFGPFERWVASERLPGRKGSQGATIQGELKGVKL